MAGNTVKDMTTNFGKLDKFVRHDFRRWQKKMHFLLTTLKVVYVLTTPMPELVEDATVKAIRIRTKWENDDYICRGHILNGMSYSLFDVYTNVESAKELWDSLESKYMAEDSSSKKFLVDAIVWWIDSGATTHVCKDRCWFKTYEPVEDGSVLYMGDEHFAPVHGKGSVALEFSSGKTITLFNVLYVPKLRIIHETTAPYTPQQNGVAERKNRAIKEMVNSMLSYSGLSEEFWGEAMLTDCYLLNRVPNKRNKTTPYELWYKKRPNLSYLRVWGYRAVVRLSDPKRKTLGEKGIDCIFVGYAEHSKAYRSKDVILNLVESQRDDHSDDVPSEIPEPRKEPMKYWDAAFWKEAVDDEFGSIMENNTWVLSDLPPGCKPLGFRQKEGIDYFDTSAPVARITTIRLLLALAAIHNLVIHQMDVKTTFLNGDLDEKVYMKDLLCRVMSIRFSMKDMGEANVILGIKIKRENKGIVITQSHYIEKILNKFNHEDCSPVSTPIDPVEKLKPNTGKPVDQLEYSRAIGCLMYAMMSTRPDIAYAVDRLSRFTSNHKISLRVLVFPAWRVHLWASKKQTCITGSTMESEFAALATTGKEAEWLRNLIHEIPIWPKPIASISIHCNSAATLVKAYSQMYNGKSRHLGVRHSMIRGLIMNGVICIEFVRSQ
ncbi:zinc finger, CCHC-type containing protein [Tanacetum coccineum]